MSSSSSSSSFLFVLLFLSLSCVVVVDASNWHCFNNGTIRIPYKDDLRVYYTYVPHEPKYLELIIMTSDHRSEVRIQYPSSRLDMLVSIWSYEQAKYAYDTYPSSSNSSSCQQQSSSPSSTNKQPFRYGNDDDEEGRKERERELKKAIEEI
jgi:hypothetical protein